MSPHLSEETLNEYLDGALAGPERISAEAHLAACAICADQVKALAALFAELGSLPEAPPQKDLRSSVMAALRVRARGQVGLRAIVDPGRPAFKVIFAAQMVAALALLAVAWPVLAGLALPLWPIVAVDLGALASPLANSWPDPSRLWLALPGWLTPPVSIPSSTFSPLVMGVGLLAAGGFWLLVNAFLLRPPSAPRLRRHT